ncbi:MAG TPA: hypothetical protein VNB22_22550 [Pyrinomonadaceae bacterium]|nr:hypothetical protein [Pyrinomonadaceae bacterium]
MKFDKGIDKKYRQSIEDAFETILEKGNERHRRTLKLILDSKMTVCVHPVSKVNASGITGVVDPSHLNDRIESERMSLQDAFDELFITIAEETIDTGFQRGCEGTFAHENQHAFDFAQTIESFSNADINPLSIFNPTLYEMEWEAHLAAGEYMLQISKDEYLDEGLALMVLGRGGDGNCFVDHDGIKRRLKESYGLELNGSLGMLASQMLGLKER